MDEVVKRDFMVNNTSKGLVINAGEWHYVIHV